jgi:hypothetical protein
LSAIPQVDLEIQQAPFLVVAEELVEIQAWVTAGQAETAELMEEPQQAMAQAAAAQVAMAQQGEVELMDTLEFSTGALTNAWRS